MAPFLLSAGVVCQSKHIYHTVVLVHMQSLARLMSLSGPLIICSLIITGLVSILARDDGDDEMALLS